MGGDDGRAGGVTAGPAIVLLTTRRPPGTQYLRAAGWGAVVLASLVGLRRSAAALAWATVLGEAVLLARLYGMAPTGVRAAHRCETARR